MSGQKPQSFRAIAQIYEGGKDLDTAEKIIKEKKKTMQKQTSTVTAREAFFTRLYRTGSLVSLAIMIIHQLCGMNVILLYSNTIIAEMPGGFLTPRQGTYVIGVWNFISSCVSLYSAKNFSRRFLMVGGQFAMGVAHVGVGAFIMLGFANCALGSRLLFMFFF